MATITAGQSQDFFLSATGGLFVTCTGVAKISYENEILASAGSVSASDGEVRIGYFGVPMGLAISALSGTCTVNTSPSVIEPLTARQAGDNNDSSPLDIKLTVNGLINSTRPRRAACAGVSFMAQQTQDAATTKIFRDIGYLTHLFALMGWPWRWDIASNFAVGGTTAALILSDQVPAILASHATDPIDTIFIAMGTNDSAASIPYATIIANMDSIITALTYAGIRVVMETIPPRGVDVSLQSYKLVSMNINRWLAKQELLGRIVLVDITQVMADVTTAFGNALPALTYDPASALHPNTKGAKLISREFFNKLSKMGYQPTITYATQVADVYDATNNPTGSIFDNPLLQGGTTAPTGYTTSGGTWSAANNTLPNGQLKRAWSVSLLTSTIHYFYKDLLKSGAGWSGGDRIQSGDVLEGRCRVTVTGATGLRSVQFYLVENNGSGDRMFKCLSNSTTNELNSMDGTYTYDLKTPLCPVRAYSGSGNSSVYIRCDFITEASGAAGTVTVEAFELRKVIS